MWIKDQTGIHKKSAHCRFSRDQQIRSNRPRKPGESTDQLINTINWSKATVIDREQDSLTSLIKEVIHIRKEGAQSMNRDEGSYQLKSCIWPLSWHVKFRFSSCQEPEVLVPASSVVSSSSDESLWQRPERQQKVRIGCDEFLVWNADRVFRVVSYEMILYWKRRRENCISYITCNVTIK